MAERTAELARLNEKLVRDIAKRQEVEAALRESEARYRDFFENAHDMIQSVGRDGRFIFTNPAWLETLGYSREELVHLKLFDIIHPDSIPLYQEKFSMVTAGKPVFNIDTTFKAKDGSWVTVEGNVVPRVKDDQVIATQGFFRNVTERKRAEAKLKESEKRFRMLFENSGDAIFVFAADGEDAGKIVLANQATADMHGYTLDEILTLSIQDLDTPEAAQNIQGRFKRVFAGEWIKEEITHRRKDGTGFPVEISAGMLELEGRKYILALDRDITERKQAEDALRKAHDNLELRVVQRTRELADAVDELKTEIAARKQVEQKLKKAKDKEKAANQAKSEFLANMSHELRTPLNHIIGFTQILIDEHFGQLNETQTEYLNDVLNSSMHLLALINDILDLSKVEAGKLELEPSQVDIKMLLANSLTLIKQKAMKHGIRLETDLHPNLPGTITADERKLKQIIYNLLSNAAKFTPDGGAIHLSARAVDAPDGSSLTAPKPEKSEADGDTDIQAVPGWDRRKWIEISVADTGIGINRENQAVIFDPFEQVSGSANSKNQGTGLGLSLTKRLVELHHGRIWVESEGKGRGRKFSLVIPSQRQASISE
ncbi:MAG: PAS domain S-box protein [Desulfobacterales bacterium]|nr:MAG: PAS domain S-box protein [Desulfobacterales bacterium]